MNTHEPLRDGRSFFIIKKGKNKNGFGEYDELMALTEKQWTEMYKASIKSSTDIFWIREKIQDNDVDMRKCFECITKLKGEQSFLKGYITRIAISITAIVTIIANVILWAFSYFGGK